MNDVQQAGISSRKVGDNFEGFMLIKNVTKGLASNSQPFLTLFLSDDTGTIETKLWGVSDQEVETYTTETIVHVIGVVSEYRGAIQLNTSRIRTASPEDNIQVIDLLEKAPESADSLRNEILQIILHMENPFLKQITQTFMHRYNKEFFVYPAAANLHHAFVSGLAYHTVSMLRIGKLLCDIYPELNRELLYAGIILHDIGKIHEYTSVIDSTTTLNGTLLGHIPIMVAEIKEIAGELQMDEREEITILQHMVLSHHGKPEWGSSKTPLIREAEVLHHIDNIDAKINMLNKVISKTEPGAFTEKMYALEGRSFYKPLF